MQQSQRNIEIRIDAVFATKSKYVYMQGGIDFSFFNKVYYPACTPAPRAK
ncbi:hypothetical protein IC797_00425 [Acinetobacter seifertii]|nr:hypothetical protein [Acinetobacter seifertii]QNW98215.1 hypothetical protein IC797_00425 [Acinetobacter seifertii]